MADNNNDEQQDLTDEEVENADEAQEEAFRLAQEQLKEKNKLKILADFKKMRMKYMIKSTFWPFLSYNEMQLLNKVRKINVGEYASFMQVLTTKIGAFWAKVNSFLASITPILPYILIGLLVIIAVLVIFAVVMPWLVGLFTETNDAPFGANGENFYGVRYVFRDAEQAQADLWADYASALNYTIENFDDENVTLNLEMPTSENDGKLDLSQLTDEAEDNDYLDEYNLVVEIAKAVYLADNAGVENADTLELDEILAGIKYFGFDAEIVEQISQELAQFIEENLLYTIKPAEDGTTPSIDVSDTLQPAFSSLLLKEFVTDLQTAEGAPTRTDLLYIKDYILGEDAESSVAGVGQENYVAMIYLPKNNVKISSVTYTIFGVEAADFNVAVYSNGSEVVAKNNKSFGTFTSKEVVGNEFDTYHFLAENLTLSALTFTDFEKGFLTSEKSLFNILRALKADGTNAGLLSEYLAQADETNTAFWAEGENVEGGTQGSGSGTSGGESGETDTSETNFYTFNYQTYLAVLMHNSANTRYSFTEFETNLG